MRVLFPLPVIPTIPIFSPECIVKDTSSKIYLDSLEYLKLTFLNSNFLKFFNFSAFSTYLYSLLSSFIISIISIQDYDINNPRGLFGQKLYKADQIVIPKKEFYIILDFPLRKKLKIKITDPVGDGFTLKEVIYAIQISYKNIYETEESSSTIHQYIIIADCINCNSINLKKLLINLEKNNISTSLNEIQESNIHENNKICCKKYKFRSL